MNKQMRKFFYIILLIPLLYSTPVSLWAQELNAKLTHYSTEDGLPSNAISDIAQDRQGFIWIATWNGLARFDGFNFQCYTTGPISGIPFLHNRILSITPDTEGNIWMRMYDNRIFVLNRHTDKIQPVFADINEGQQLRVNLPLTTSNNGTVFAHIEGRGICQLRLTKNVLTHYFIPIRHYQVKQILADTDNHLWLSTQYGLSYYDVKSKQLHQVHSLHGNTVAAMSRRGTQILIAMHNGKVYGLNAGATIPTLKAKLPFSPGEAITSIDTDNEGQLWYTTFQPGISRYNPHTRTQHDFKQQVPAPETDTRGATLFEYHHLLWIRMNHGGFGYYNREKDEIEYFHNAPTTPWNLSNTVPTYIALPEGVIFMTTVRRGLEKLELLNQRIIKHDIVASPTPFGANETRALLWDRVSHRLLVGNKRGEVYHGSEKLFSTNGRIYHLMQDRKGNIWVSDKDKGIFVFQPEKGILSQPLHTVSSVYQTLEDPRGIIWIATYGQGVKALSHGKFLKLHGLPQNTYNKVRTLCLVSHNEIWAGTTDGILVIKLKQHQWYASPLQQCKNKQYQLAANDIVQIKRDRKGIIWIATNGGGLSQSITIDPNGEKLVQTGQYAFENHEEANGLPSNEVRSITFDQKGIVWFATDRNICSYDPNKHLLSTFSVQDGISDVACSEAGAITLPNGNMIFGTLNGYYIVDIHRLGAHSRSSFKLAITDFFVNDQLMTPRLSNTYDYYIPDSNRVELPSRSSIFAFRFASLNYQLQHRVHYQFMLEGYDEHWRNADATRMVSYSDVPAGTYHFRVKAFLLENPNKYDERVVTVIVPPYMLLSTTALWIYLFLCLIVGGGTMWWLKHLYQKHVLKMHVLKIGPEEIAFQHTDDYDFVKAQLDWLETNYQDSQMRIEDMVQESGLSRTSFYNHLKQLTGLSPKEFIRDFRLKKACMYLKKGNCTIAEIAYLTGFNDPVYFARIFKQNMKVTPSQYRDEAHQTNEQNTDNKP